MNLSIHNVEFTTCPICEYDPVYISDTDTRCAICDDNESPHDTGDSEQLGEYAGI